jgi:hypothetical protein
MIRTLFDAEWEYTEGGTFFGMLLTPTQPVRLPHDASIGKPRKLDHPSGPGGVYAWNGVVSYRKRFHAPMEWQLQRVQLDFEGVMMHAEVWLNEHLLALHPYGYTGFLVDLTPYLQYGAENEVIVTANNSAQPNARWYTGTGLYQRMIQASASGRVGTPDEIGAAAAFLMGRDGSFISGSDLLIDGGVIASIAAGRYNVHSRTTAGPTRRAPSTRRRSEHLW